MLTQPPEMIYHYTTQKGLIGILESKAIWATNLYYLNDSSELRYTIDLIQSVLPIHLALGSEFYELTRAVIDVLKWAELASIYVASFSEDGNLLSQWQAYGSNSGGFSIGFSTAKMWAAIDRQSFRLAECIYDEEEQKRKAVALIQNLGRSIYDEWREIQTRNPATIKEIVDRNAPGFFDQFLEIATVFKAHCFYQEDEWRIISPSISHRHPQVDFRCGKSMIIPYFAFELAEKTSDLPIEEIIIGPTPHKDLSHASLTQLIDKYGLYNCKIDYCNIPFRGRQ